MTKSQLGVVYVGMRGISIGGRGAEGLQLPPPPRLAEIHFIRAISSERNIVFPENRCSSIQLNTNLFGQKMSDSGRQFAAPLNLKPSYNHSEKWLYDGNDV